MAPVFQHGKDSSLIADVVKGLLDHTKYEHDAYTSITMELSRESSIEPDYCFYIDNWESVSGKKRIDWQNDPPPDLVLEINVNSYSDINDYLPYKVPEVWLFKRDRLQIYQLQDDAYLLVNESRYFPGFDLQAISDRALQIAYDRNTSAAIRDLRQRLSSDEFNFPAL